MLFVMCGIVSLSASLPQYSMETMNQEDYIKVLEKEIEMLKDEMDRIIEDYQREIQRMVELQNKPTTV